MHWLTHRIHLSSMTLHWYTYVLHLDGPLSHLKKHL
jgi:hypothetical protein